VATKPHLIGAYGMFWDRASVNWYPGGGPKAWQMLGYRHRNKPVLRVCDFRQAAGCYVLYDDFGPTYTGLARGSGGLGARLRVHDANLDKRWSRFCWFAFDDVVDVDAQWPGWSELRWRHSLPRLSTDVTLREQEALMIAILGLQDQNAMTFQAAERWTQLTGADFLPGGVGLKVDPGGFTDERFRRLADGIED
jgi:hypothetical protein